LPKAIEWFDSNHVLSSLFPTILIMLDGRKPPHNSETILIIRQNKKSLQYPVRTAQGSCSASAWRKPLTQSNAVNKTEISHILLWSRPAWPSPYTLTSPVPSCSARKPTLWLASVFHIIFQSHNGLPGQSYYSANHVNVQSFPWCGPGRLDFALNLAYCLPFPNSIFIPLASALTLKRGVWLMRISIAGALLPLIVRIMDRLIPGGYRPVHAPAVIGYKNFFHPLMPVSASVGAGRYHAGGSNLVMC